MEEKNWKFKEESTNSKNFILKSMNLEELINQKQLSWRIKTGIAKEFKAMFQNLLNKPINETQINTGYILVELEVT